MKKKDTISEDTHLNKYGAYLITKELVRLIMESDNKELEALKNHINQDIKPVDKPEKLRVMK